MAKALAISTQLKNALAKIVELEKKLKETEDSKQSWYKSATESAATIEQLHLVLDAVPNSIPRQSTHEESWRRTDLSPATRMAAWLASRSA